MSVLKIPCRSLTCERTGRTDLLPSVDSPVFLWHSTALSSLCLGTGLPLWSSPQKNHPVNCVSCIILRHWGEKRDFLCPIPTCVLLLLWLFNNSLWVAALHPCSWISAARSAAWKWEAGEGRLVWEGKKCHGSARCVWKGSLIPLKGITLLNYLWGKSSNMLPIR